MKVDRQQKARSENTTFEMRIRADKRLHRLSCQLWLLTALSHEKGHTFAKSSVMASQLGITPRQFRHNAIVLVEARLFNEKMPVGVHRPKQYHRNYLPGETREEFVSRVQAYEQLNVAVGLHWLACDVTAETGIGEFSAHGIWPVSDEALRQARRKMEECGYFAVAPGRGRSILTKYTRIMRVKSEGDTKVTYQPDDPTEEQRERAADKRAERALRELEQEQEPAHQQAERARRLRLALELGLDPETGEPLPGRPLKPRKKEVLVPQRLFYGRRTTTDDEQ